MGDRIQHVVEIGPGGAASTAYQGSCGGKRQLAGKLSVLAIGEIDQRRHCPPVVEMDRPDRLLVNAVIVDLAINQIAAHLVVGRSRQAMGETAAGAARQQAQDQPRSFRRAAIMLGIDAEGAVPALQAGGLSLGRGEARIPHQRAVAEDPARPGGAHA